INDNHGHHIGDLVIKKVSEIIRNNIRNEDISVRWGGEEFVIVLDFHDKEELMKKAELIRMSVMENPIYGLSVTVSVGISSQLSISFNKQFKNADLALYQAKNSGRNKVVFYESK
ncbi:GGDEF domain-containing protein, partial [Photobacterium lucens]